MPLRPALLVAASLFLASCGQDNFDQRYRDAEAQVRKEDRDLASQLPAAQLPASSPSAAKPAEASSAHP